MTSLPALWRCLVDVVAIVDAIADALDFAHQRGLLHRDVKPANIFMTAGASQRRILLADFGIGREIAHTGGFAGNQHDGRDRQLRCAGAVRHAAVGAASRRVPLRLQHDRPVEVSHAGRVQPAARDLVQIRRRPPSVRTPTPLGWPRAPRGRRRRRVRARSPSHWSTSSTALPAPGELAAVLIAMNGFR
jgi:serine/threonine protein kinase